MLRDVGLAARAGSVRFVLRAIVLGVGCCAILTTSAQALVRKIVVHAHNRTGHTLIVGPTDSSDIHYLGPGGTWTTPHEKTQLSINVFRHKPSGSGVIECGELEFVNPVVGFPEVKLFKVAERPKHGFADAFRFAVNEEHTFRYATAKLVVKRLPDEVRRHPNDPFPPVFKVFDLDIEHC